MEELRTPQTDTVPLPNRPMEAEIALFVATFPQVEPKDVPAAVWQQVEEGGTLTLAYALFRLTQLEEQVIALTGQKDATARSTGSLTSAGAPQGNGSLESYWDAYQL